MYTVQFKVEDDDRGEGEEMAKEKREVRLIFRTIKSNSGYGRQDLLMAALHSICT